MESNYKKKSRPQRIKAAAEEINKIYKEKFKENIINTMIMCGHIIYKELYESYIKPYDESDNVEERKELMSQLVEKLRNEGLNAQRQLEEAHRMAQEVKLKDGADNAGMVGKEG